LAYSKLRLKNSIALPKAIFTADWKRPVFHKFGISVVASEDDPPAGRRGKIAAASLY
jgi:hypothetical protein